MVVKTTKKLKMKKLVILFFLPISIISQEIDFFEPNLTDVPLARKYKNIVKVYSWFDSLGKNTLIITAREGCGDGYDKCDLRAYHYTGNSNLLWDIKDYEKGLGIELDQIELTDIDDDDIAEISILYTIRGRSISTVKLIMHEKGKKYAIRGKTGYDYNDECVYEYDMYGKNSFESAKSSFRGHALGLYSDMYNCYSD